MKITRKEFIKNTALGFAGISIGSEQLIAKDKMIKSMDNAPIIRHNKIMKFKNVKLEIGFEFDNNEVVGTKTGLFSIEIEYGKIKKIYENSNDSDAIDVCHILYN